MFSVQYGLVSVVYLVCSEVFILVCLVYSKMVVRDACILCSLFFVMGVKGAIWCLLVLHFLCSKTVVSVVCILCNRVVVRVVSFLCIIVVVIVACLVCNTLVFSVM